MLLVILFFFFKCRTFYWHYFSRGVHTSEVSQTISRNLSNTMGERKVVSVRMTMSDPWGTRTLWMVWWSMKIMRILFVDFEDLILKGDFFWPACETMLSTWCFQLETISFRVEKDRGGEAREYLENVGFSLIMFIISRNLSNTMTQFSLWGKKSSNSWKQFSGHKCGDFCCVLQADFVWLLV